MPNRLKNLPAIAPPSGFVYIPDFISELEEIQLVTQLQKLDWEEVKMHGVVARRRVIHFGLTYYYDTRSVAKTTPPPEFLMPFLDKAADFLNVKTPELEEILITEYSPGAGIGWHRDSPPFDKIFGMSLSSACILKLRKQHTDYYEVYKAELQPRSAYIFEGEARSEWQHHIPSVKNLRYSLTFRTMRKSYLR